PSRFKPGNDASLAAMSSEQIGEAPGQGGVGGGDVGLEALHLLDAVAEAGEVGGVAAGGVGHPAPVAGQRGFGVELDSPGAGSEAEGLVRWQGGPAEPDGAGGRPGGGA